MTAHTDVTTLDHPAGPRRCTATAAALVPLYRLGEPTGYSACERCGAHVWTAGPPPSTRPRPTELSGL